MKIGYPAEEDGSDFLNWLTENETQITKLIGVLTDNYVKYKNSNLEAEKVVYEKKVEQQIRSLQDRQVLTKIFIVAFLVIFLIIAFLTYTGNFDGTTLAFFLGTSVGSLLTILGKIYTFTDLLEILNFHVLVNQHRPYL